MTASVTRLCGWLLVFLCLASAACADHDALRLGAKPFPEQEILAEIIGDTLTAAEIQTRPVHRCEDTFECERALQSGYIDVMVEYSGTALNLLGEPAPVDGDVMQRVRALYRPMGVEWLVPLGFDNGYRWLVPSNRAEAMNLHTLTDLAGAGSIRVAIPPEYIRRPRDGLMATAEAYGLQIEAEPLVIVDAMERYEATMSGKADVAVGYATDGPLHEWGLTALSDDRHFFPPYEAAIVVRTDALQQTAGLRDALMQLQGSIDNDQMREMNHDVVLHGEPVRVVADRFLQANDLAEEPQRPRRGRTPLRIAYAAEPAKQAFGARAVGAVREVFPERTVELHPVRDPADAVAQAKARFAIVGAEHFFFRDRRGDLQRREDLEAIAVLGRRVVHVVARETAPNDPLSGKLGVPETGSGARLGEALMRAENNTAVRRDSVDALVDAVVSRELDAAVIVAPAGDARVAAALERGLVLRPLSGWLTTQRHFEIPYLRPTRLRPDAYSGLTEAIDTLGAQVVLAGPSRFVPHLVNASGPAAAVPTSGTPLRLEQLEALAEAVGIAEAPDPALPSIWTIGTTLDGPDEVSRVAETLLNVIVIAFLAWLIVITLAPEPPAKAQDE